MNTPLSRRFITCLFAGMIACGGTAYSADSEKRSEQAKIELHKFLAECDNFQHEKLQKTDAIIVAKYIGYTLGSDAVAGPTVDFLFSPVQALKGPQDKRLTVSDPLVNVKKYGMTEEAFKKRYVAGKTYLLLGTQTGTDKQNTAIIKLKGLAILPLDQ